MAKSNAKKDGAKKGPAKKSTAKKTETETAKVVAETKEVDNATPETVEAVVKAETPEEVKEVLDSVDETANSEPEIAQDLTATDTEDETVEETATPDPQPEPAENVKEDTPEPQTEAEPTVVVVKNVGKPAPVAADHTWKDRVRIEAKDLKEKMVALRTAITDRKVPLDQVPILNEQHAAMQAYYIILNRRLSS